MAKLPPATNLDGDRRPGAPHQWRLSPAGLALAASLLLFGAVVADLLARGWLFRLDSQAQSLMIAGFPNKLPPALLFLAALGAALASRPAVGAAIILFLGYLCFRRQWRQLVVFMGALGGGEMVINLLKAVFHRPRPPHPLGLPGPGYSFPSGDAFTAVILYGFLAYLLWGRIPGRRGKVALLALLSGPVLLVGWSRFYFWAHWLSDILAAYLAGLAWLLLSIILVTHFWPARKAAVAPEVPPPG